MSKIIVSDASPLIALAKLNRLELLLSVFQEVHIPNSVYLETTASITREDTQRIIKFVGEFDGTHCFLHQDLKTQLKAPEITVTHIGKA